MKIVLPGGSGRLGTILAHVFFNDGHEVIVLSRNHKAQEAFLWKAVHWDGESLGTWVDEFRGADAVAREFDNPQCPSVTSSRVAFRKNHH